MISKFKRAYTLYRLFKDLKNKPKDKPMKQWLLDRAKEPSTWKGISLIAAMFGVTLAPELLLELGTAVTVIIGAIETMRRENP